MKNIQVLGIGSPFGDDQLGWMAIDTLMSDSSLQFYIPHQLALKKLDRPGLSLLADLQDAWAVILIDAIVNNGEIGKIYRLAKSEIITTKNLISSHNISIAEALKLGEGLNMLPDKIVLYGMEIDTCQMNDAFSEKIKSSFYHFITAIYEEIRILLTHAK